MAGIDFIQELGVAALAAAVAGWICHRFGLPLVLGYMTAGILAGPYLGFFATLDDLDRIHGVAQVGMTFLVFNFGRRLRLQRLTAGGVPLILATLVTAILVFNSSRLLGQALGWPAIYGLVLAGMLMVSSSAIIERAVREANALHSVSGQAALTVTALDNVLAVLLLTLLGLMGASPPVAPAALLEPFVRLLGITSALFVAAVLMIVPLLKRLDRNGPGELRALFIGGLLLALALLSSRTGFSAAIGAFLLGTAVASSGRESWTQDSLNDWCNVFSALFFVSVGMLLNPRQLAEVWPLVLLVFGFALLCRGVSASLALLLVGYKTGEAVRSGVSLTPLGEFSLIIALVAAQAELVPGSFYALAVGLCVLGTITAPVLIRRPGKVSEWIERHLPEFLLKMVRFYHDRVESFRQRQRSSLFWRLAGPRWVQLVVQMLFISGLLALASPAYQLVEKWLAPSWPSSDGLPLLFWFTFLLLVLAPAVSLWRTIEAVSMICAEAATQDHPGRSRLQPAFQKLLQGAGCAGVLLWCSLFVPYESMPLWSVSGVLVAGVGLALVSWRKLVSWHSRFEIDLRMHLGEPMSTTATQSGDRWQRHSEQWHLGVREHRVSRETRAAGTAIRDLPLRQMFSCTIVSIERQGYHLPNPSPDTILYPEDRVLLLGSEPALRQAECWLGAACSGQGTHLNGGGPAMEELCLDQVVVPGFSRYVGRPLGDLDLTRRLGIQVVGIQRDGLARAVAGKHDVLLPGDRLLVLGRQQQISDMVFWLAS